MMESEDDDLCGTAQSIVHRSSIDPSPATMLPNDSSISSTSFLISESTSQLTPTEEAIIATREAEMSTQSYNETSDRVQLDAPFQPAYNQLSPEPIDGGNTDNGSDSSYVALAPPNRFQWWDNLVKKWCKGDIKVALFAAGLLFASTGNSIFFKKMTNKMYNYPYFLSQLTTFVYLPIFFGVVLYEFKFTNYITPEMTSFPKKKFLFMGLFDALSGIFMLFGGIHSSGSYQALLLNAVIPFTLGLSVVFLGTKYAKTEYLGAAVIMGGVAVVMVPNVITGNSDGNSVLFNLIFLLSTIPQAFSSIYKELAFGDVDLDVNYLQAWVALFQFFIGLALCPLNSLPFLGSVYIPFHDIPYTILNGGKCMAGINTVVNSTITEADGSQHGSCWLDTNNKWGAPTDTECDSCEGAWIPIFLYVCFNCFYNLFIVLVIKYGSAALLWIILTLRLPLVQIAFAISVINDPPDQFKITSIIGLFVILAGLVLYRYASVAGKKPEVGVDGELTERDATDGADGEHGHDETNKLHSESFNQRLTHTSTSDQQQQQ